MKVIIVGSGSATPDPERGNPSQAVIVDDEILLFDCGERTSVNLVKAGINPIDVDYLFFTHLHIDHTADYKYFIYTTWNCGRKKLLKVYGPGSTEVITGTKEMTEIILNEERKIMKMYNEKYVSPKVPVSNRPPLEYPMELKEIGEGRIFQGNK